jgi:hypothetical protein
MLLVAEMRVISSSSGEGTRSLPVHRFAFRDNQCVPTGMHSNEASMTFRYLEFHVLTDGRLAQIMKAF